MSPKYQIVTNLAKALGFHGISPESITTMRVIADRNGFGSDEVRLAYESVMSDFRAFFAPVDVEDAAQVKKYRRPGPPPSDGEGRSDKFSDRAWRDV